MPAVIVLSLRLPAELGERLFERVPAGGRNAWLVRVVEQALADDTQAGASAGAEALRGVEGHHTRVSPSPAGAASVRGASEPSAPAERPDEPGGSRDREAAADVAEYREILDADPGDSRRLVREFRPYPKGG